MNYKMGVGAGRLQDENVLLTLHAIFNPSYYQITYNTPPTPTPIMSNTRNIVIPTFSAVATGGTEGDRSQKHIDKCMHVHTYNVLKL